MFKNEIQKLAAEQVVERTARTEMKASDADRTQPIPMTHAWLQASAYTQFFISSDRRKEQRRAQIRVRHLIEAFKAGVPYNVLEKKTHIPVYDLACAMITVMRAFGVSHVMEDVYAWLDVDATQGEYVAGHRGEYKNFYRKHWGWNPKYLGVPQFENAGVFVA